MLRALGIGSTLREKVGKDVRMLLIADWTKDGLTEFCVDGIS